MKQTAVEWLYKKMDYVNWMRNRDEISTGMADEWRKHYLEQAKAMEKEQIIECWDNGFANGYDLGKHDDQPNPDDAEQYYNETFKSE